MTQAVIPLDYPAWLRIDHWLNVLFPTLLLRSGIPDRVDLPQPGLRQAAQRNRPGRQRLSQ
jgi:hypothetical protein